VLAALRDGGSGGYFGALCTLAGIKPAPGQFSDPAIPPVPSRGETARQQHCVFCVSGAWQPPLDVSLTLPAPDATGMAAPHGGESASPSTAASLQPLSPRAPPPLD
jgi:hypothetical protein